MTLQDIDKIADLFSSYFADQDVTTGAREIALVYSQTWQMQQQVTSLLNLTERLIRQQDSRLIDIFANTCLFIPTQDMAYDFNEITGLVSQIKSVIVDFWQNPNNHPTFDERDQKTQSVDYEMSYLAANAAISYLLGLTDNRTDIDDAQIEKAMNIGKRIYGRTLTSQELDLLKKDVLFLLNCRWDILCVTNNNRGNFHELIRRMLM